ANIHAGEVTGSASVLWLIHHMLTSYGNDDDVTRLLDTSVLYAIPRINCDGSEAYLTSAAFMRSSVRPYPEPEQQDGLYQKDMDGDGWVTNMRIKDPNGPWKVSAKDARLMVPRGPDEYGGEYYFVMPEGEIKNWDGGEIPLAQALMGLDHNRNFPFQWAPEDEQPGAGPYPLSEPETRAVAEFMLARPNICTSQHFHTFSAAILRPSSQVADDDMPKFDVHVYKSVGQLMSEDTGYPCISIFHDFAYDRRKTIKGSVLDWVYQTFGAYAYSTELWSLWGQAGIEPKDLIAYMRDRPEEDDVAMLKVLDERADGHGYQGWRPFDHPQLGPVEIGGFEFKFALQNPPGPMLSEVASRNGRSVLRLLGVLPRLDFTDARAEPVSDGVYRVSGLVQNTGFLPTWLSDVGKKIRHIKETKVTITCPDDVELLSDRDEAKVGHLDGRASSYESFSFFPRYGNTTRKRVSWIVKGAPGAVVSLQAEATKGGVARAEVTLPD
ncbi:MAG TPA: M14 family metallopeptidase, partial [Thermomicrobiales bacterium]|nr:M14 family metallopeptidase [Thermomicrobiales bacterium]